MAAKSDKFVRDGFVIENCIIKGDEEYCDVKENNLGELIFNALNERPEYIGQIVALTGKRRTFAEIKEQSFRLAARLRKEAVGPGDVVSLFARRHPDTEVIFCAVSFVGAIYNVDLARHCIKTVWPKIVFAHKIIIATLQEAAALENHALKIVVIDSDSDSDYKSLDFILNTASSRAINDFEVTQVNSDDTCVIFHTWSTTGIPKFDINGKTEERNRIILTYFYPGWLVQTLFSIRSIIIQQTLVFHEEFEPHETYKHSSLGCIHVLAESDVMNKYDVKSVTRIHTIGSKLFDEDRGNILKIFPNAHAIGRGLGILETGILTLFINNCRNTKSEGVVVPNVQLKIIDTVTGKLLGHNKAGGLCAKSPSVMSGYYKDSKATKAAFDDDDIGVLSKTISTSNVFAIIQLPCVRLLVGWLYTGDEAYYDQNGEVIVVGRLKEFIKYRETELQPLLIEQILLSHPNIVDAAVIGIFHKTNIEEPVAFIQITKGSNVSYIRYMVIELLSCV